MSRQVETASGRLEDYEIVGETASEEVIEKLAALVGKAWSDGYAQGQSDGTMAEEFEASRSWGVPPPTWT